MRTAAIWTMVALTAWICAPAVQAETVHRHHHTVPPSEPLSGPPRIPSAYSYYPHEIEGGVSGNLPFNNQIRKHVDPLNANGGGG